MYCLDVSVLIAIAGIFEKDRPAQRYPCSSDCTYQKMRENKGNQTTKSNQTNCGISLCAYFGLFCYASNQVSRADRIEYVACVV